MIPRHTKSCNCHAIWCQHSRIKFDDSFTKRAFRADQNRSQEHQILRLPAKIVIFHDLQNRATLATILHIAQNPHVLHISRFPKIDTARRRDCASETDLARPPVSRRRNANFDVQKQLFCEPAQWKRKGPKFAPRPKRLYSDRKNPSVCHTIWGKSERPMDPKSFRLIRRF